MSSQNPVQTDGSDTYGKVVAATVACLVLLGVTTASASAMQNKQPTAQNVASLVTKPQPKTPKEKPRPTVEMKPVIAQMTDEELYLFMLHEQQEADRQYFASIAPPAPSPTPAPATLAAAPVGSPAPAPQPVAHQQPAPTPAPAPAAYDDKGDDGGRKDKGRKHND